MVLDGFASESQELALCQNSKLGLTPKGKEVIISENSKQDEELVERDFINQIETKVNSSSNREVPEEDETERENVIKGKKPKLQNVLDLSLALPSTNLSLTASNALQNADRAIKLSAETSDDFTAALPSYTQVTQESNNKHGDSGSGSGSVEFSIIQSHRVTNKGSFSGLYLSSSSNNLSFFPSKSPARALLVAHSDDSRHKNTVNLRDLEDLDAGEEATKLCRPERILLFIASESISVISQIIQKLAKETLKSTKGYLKDLIAMPQKRDELVGLQNRLERRSDLTKEALSNCQNCLLEILIALRMGLSNFISGEVSLPAYKLVGIFLYMRCRNVNCMRRLPVDGCNCKLCSANKGFCSSCMCLVCMNFDCAVKTCNWVGCDVCSHWCHAACAVQYNLFSSEPSLKGPSGTAELQYHCIQCNHASEMFGFVKDAFVSCAEDWDLETLIKELECVTKIFKGSEDYKGKETLVKAQDLISKLESKTISPSVARKIIIYFFVNCPNHPVSTNHPGSQIHVPSYRPVLHGDTKKPLEQLDRRNLTCPGPSSKVSYSVSWPPGSSPSYSRSSSFAYRSAMQSQGSTSTSTNDTNWDLCVFVD